MWKHSKTHWRYATSNNWLSACALGFITLSCALMGLFASGQSISSHLIWPANIVGLAFLLHHRAHAWWRMALLFFLGSALAGLIYGLGLVPNLGLALANSVEVFTAGLLVRRRHTYEAGDLHLKSWFMIAGYYLRCFGWGQCLVFYYFPFPC